MHNQIFTARHRENVQTNQYLIECGIYILSAAAIIIVMQVFFCLILTQSGQVNAERLPVLTTVWSLASNQPVAAKGKSSSWPDDFTFLLPTLSSCILIYFLQQCYALIHQLNLRTSDTKNDTTRKEKTNHNFPEETTFNSRDLHQI